MGRLRDFREIYNKNILKAIEQCDLFMCDLTYLNPNVLYELGYAIAKEKKYGLR